MARAQTESQYAPLEQTWLRRMRDQSLTVDAFYRTVTNPQGAIGAAVFGLLIFVAIFADLLAPFGEAEQIRGARLLAPSGVLMETPLANSTVPPEAGNVPSCLSANTLLAVANRRDNARVKLRRSRGPILCRENLDVRTASLLADIPRYEPGLDSKESSTVCSESSPTQPQGRIAHKLASVNPSTLCPLRFFILHGPFGKGNTATA